MEQWMFDAFGIIGISYSGGVLLSYIIMMVLAGTKVIRHYDKEDDSYKKELVYSSPYLPGVSIVAPAYNEEKTIVDNVHSLLEQDYPEFEVVIVNDGSKDSTLEKLITEFDMVKIPYDYVEKLHTKPFRAVYHSFRPEYSRLFVVDKMNGGTKADAMNAGLNIARFNYFINTDVDCILSRDAIFNSIMPILRDNTIIAVSGAMTMSNGCDVDQGRLLNRKATWKLVPLFQTLEYMRSFYVGKMAWSVLGGMPNVSGGYGMFNRDVVIGAGGYRGDSFAEDMEMLLDMEKYCVNVGMPYRVVQIPATCCWTEGPSTLKLLYRQRSRWARGLMQTFDRHKDMVFTKRYGTVSKVTMPYLFIFEYIAPIIEALGMMMIIYLLFNGGIYWTGAIIIFFALYSFNLLLANCVITYDYISGGTFDKPREYLKLYVASMLEPIFYHPFITYFSLVGYCKQLFGVKQSWGTMTRKGYSQHSNPDQAPQQSQNTPTEA